MQWTARRNDNLFKLCEEVEIRGKTRLSISEKFIQIGDAKAEYFINLKL